MEEKNTKICKVCGKEKNLNEFQTKGKGYYDSKCKVCKWFSKKDIDYNQTNWTQEEDVFIIDSLLNEKYSINEIADKLNKNIKELCERIVNDLKVGGTTKLPLTVKCTNCDETIKVAPNVVIRNNNNFCSKQCHDEYQIKHPYKTETIIDKICPMCGKSFQVTKHNKKQIHCSRECSSLAKEDKIIIQCKICNKDIRVKRSMATKTVTCSDECATENRRRICEEKSLAHTITKVCEYCGIEYDSLLSQEDSRFCCKECYNKWMSENLVGVNNPRFTRQLIKCDYCGENHYQKLHRINSNQKNFFCSAKCRQSWFAEVYSQTEEWKKERSIIAVNSLSNGNNPRVDTVPQIVLNHLLDDMNIEFTNEYNCKYYSLDNHLTKYNLAIECMGTFWHADNRKYDKISSDIQVKRIRTDKAKRTYIESQYHIPILYIWEYDLLNNLDMCKELILEYINCEGKLLNYHSFNYFMYNEMLFLDTKIIKPYMDWDIKELNSIIDLSVKDKMRKRDESKWISFNCENCGDIKEQLVSRYNKSKHHFCSISCTSMFYYNERITGIDGRIIS